MSKVSDVLGAMKAEMAKAATEEATMLAQRNAALKEAAERDLRGLFGGMADELLACVVQPAYQVLENGRLAMVTWWVASEELQLAPTHIEWKPRRQECGGNEFTITIQDGKRGRTWGDVGDDRFTDVLLDMHTAYGPWLEAKEAEAAKEQAQVKRELERTIGILCHPNAWGHSVGEAEVLKRYDDLVRLGRPELAAEKWTLWQGNVAAWQREQAEREERRRQAEAAEAAYQEAIAGWKEACRAWAEAETAMLWEPWHVWRVRYVAYNASFAAADAEEMAPIETVYMLDEPVDVVNAMRPVALVDRVEFDGEVKPGFVLATFLDGVRVDYNAPTIEEKLRHHRAYWAGGFVVNVPAHVLDEPTPAPVRPERVEQAPEIEPSF